MLDGGLDFWVQNLDSDGGEFVFVFAVVFACWVFGRLCFVCDFRYLMLDFCDVYLCDGGCGDGFILEGLEQKLDGLIEFGLDGCMGLGVRKWR